MTSRQVKEFFRVTGILLMALVVFVLMVFDGLFAYTFQYWAVRRFNISKDAAIMILRGIKIALVGVVLIWFLF